MSMMDGTAGNRARGMVLVEKAATFCATLSATWRHALEEKGLGPTLWGCVPLVEFRQTEKWVRAELVG
jgi:hypothetical protein